MATATTTYLGELRVEAVHDRSGQRLFTDAPPDNRGKGQAFSPTDLLCTSLACCMMTLMGIRAYDQNIPLAGVKARIFKHMHAEPRRVSRVEVHMELSGSNLDPGQRAQLENAALTCPVALSLHPDIDQDVQFTYT